MPAVRLPLGGCYYLLVSIVEEVKYFFVLFFFTAFILLDFTKFHYYRKHEINQIYNNSFLNYCYNVSTIVKVIFIYHENLLKKYKKTFNFFFLFLHQHTFQQFITKIANAEMVRKTQTEKPQGFIKGSGQE